MGARRHNGDAQLVGQELDGIQGRPLVPKAARQQMLDFIHQEHAGRRVLEHTDCSTFKFMEAHGE
jgi:hypothetical protein